MTTTWQHVEHLVYGILGTAVGLVLLLTNHVEAGTGVAIIMASLGMGTTSAVAARAISLAATLPPVESPPTGGRVPVVVGSAISAPAEPVAARAASARPPA